MGRPGSRFHRVLLSAKWARVRRAKLQAAGWRCEGCGRPGALEVHHIRPLHRGGAPFDLSNLQALCRACHTRIHARQLSEPERAWRDLVRAMLDAAESCDRLPT